MIKMASSTLCDDISEFLDALKKMRILDDKIVHSLNTSIPTESFSTKVDATTTCKDLFTQLVTNHTKRDNTLRTCVNSTIANLKILQEDRVSKPDDINIRKRLRKEQSKLRELQTEEDVEAVIRNRTLKLYHERCRTFYKPPPLQSEQS